MHNSVTLHECVTYSNKTKVETAASLEIWQHLKPPSTVDRLVNLSYPEYMSLQKFKQHFSGSVSEQLLNVPLDT